MNKTAKIFAAGVALWYATVVTLGILSIWVGDGRYEETAWLLGVLGLFAVPVMGVAIDANGGFDQ